MCVKTDENPKVFLLCGFCRPEAHRSGSVPARFPGRNLMFFARGKTRKKLEQVAISHLLEIFYFVPNSLSPASPRPGTI